MFHFRCCCACWVCWPPPPRFEPTMSSDCLNSPPLLPRHRRIGSLTARPSKAACTARKDRMKSSWATAWCGERFASRPTGQRLAWTILSPVSRSFAASSPKRSSRLTVCATTSAVWPANRITPTSCPSGSIRCGRLPARSGSLASTWHGPPSVSPGSGCGTTRRTRHGHLKAFTSAWTTLPPAR